MFFLIFCRAWVIIRFARGGRLAFALFFVPRGKAFMVRRVMKDAFVVWKNSRSIFGLTNYFAGQPRVAGAILSILFGLFLSACGGGGAGSPPNVATTVTPPLPMVMMDDLKRPIFVDAPVQGLHYRPVGPVTLISRSQETDGRGGFDPLNYGAVAFAVGEITVVGEISVSVDGMTTVTVDNGDGLTLSQYKSNGFLGFIVHPAGEWQYGVFTPYDLRNANGNAVITGTVNVGAVARVLQGFDQTPPSTSPVGFNVDDNLILIHLGATAGRTVTIDRSSPAGQFSVQELDETGTVSTNIVRDEDNYTVVISMALETENSPGYDGATLRFPLHSNAMETLSMVIADMADEISPFSDNSAITLKNGEARTGYFARRGSYSLDRGESDASINLNTGELTYTPTHGEPPQSVVVTFRYGGDQIIRNQTVELDSLPKLKTDSKDFQIYFTGGKPVALTLKETKGGNLPLRYELGQLSTLKNRGLIFDHESGILSGTPRQKAFTVNVALDIFDSGGDDAKPLEPDLEFQIVSREGAPAYYEIDLRGGAGSFATLHFPDRDGNEVSEESTEESIAGIDSACQDGSAAGFGNTDCPYSADYIFGGAKHPEGLGDIPGVMVVVGLKSTGGGNTVCAGGTCPAGVKAFTISFQNENDGKPLSVNARVLLPRPAFDPASASSIFVKYIQGSPNPLRRPLPAADGGNGRLIYSIDFPDDLMMVDFPAALTTGLAFHKATRRLLKSPPENAPVTTYPLRMTVTDLNGNGDSAAYLFTIEVQEDIVPRFDNAKTAFTVDLTVAATLTLPEATLANREIRYSDSIENTSPRIIENAPPGMMSFDPQTRQLSGTPTEAASLHFVFDYIATDPDEDYDENGISHSADDDITILMISVFVDGKPSFGDQTVPTLNYIANSQITDLTLSVATGGNGSLTYSLAPLPTGLTFDMTMRVLSGTPTGGATVITLIYTVTDSDPTDKDSEILSVTVNIVGDAKPSFEGVDFVDRNYIETWPITPAFLPGVASDGNGDTTYTIAGLPEGLDFDRETRELSGTPEVALAETFQVLLIASDSDGNNADTDRSTLVFNIMLEDEVAPTLSAVSEQNYLQNSQIVNLTLPAATGGNGGVTMYSLTPPPTGLTFNSDHTVRVLSGTPRVSGEFTLIYIATDSDPLTPEAGPDSATVSITINIEEDIIPSFTESVPQQNYFQGEEIAMTVLPAASEGNVSLIYEDALGLPDGIVFATASRQLSGTPTVFGEFVATIVAIDTEGTTDDSDDDRATLTFSIQVEEDIEPSFGSLEISDQTYTVSVQINNLPLPEAERGNKRPLMYSLGRSSSPILPDGLFFNSATRIITGTPTEIGVFDNINYVVQDSNGRSSTPLVFTITVVAPPPSP